jgi:hypothetical protein
MECIPCFLRQTLDVLVLVDADEPTRREAMRSVLREMADATFDQSPPALARHVHRTIREGLGCRDPYAAVKVESNELALSMIDALREEVQQADDPLAASLRLAIAGNIIDYGVGHDVSPETVRKTIEEAIDRPVNPAAVDRLRNRLDKADRILYLADNAGEIVLDRLVIEQLPPGKVTVAVRRSPILNDVTRHDAEAAGLNQIARIIDNGNDAPGTILPDCSEEFRSEFDSADVIIAKGQGNFESLTNTPSDTPLLMVFQAKCSLVCSLLGVEQYTPMMIWRDDVPPELQGDSPGR